MISANTLNKQACQTLFETTQHFYDTMTVSSEGKLEHPTSVEQSLWALLYSLVGLRCTQLDSRYKETPENELDVACDLVRMLVISHILHCRNWEIDVDFADIKKWLSRDPETVYAQSLCASDRKTTNMSVKELSDFVLSSRFDIFSSIKFGLFVKSIEDMYPKVLDHYPTRLKDLQKHIAL